MSAPLSLAAWLDRWRLMSSGARDLAAADARDEVQFGLAERAINPRRAVALDAIVVLLDALARDEVQP